MDIRTTHNTHQNREYSSSSDTISQEAVYGLQASFSKDSLSCHSTSSTEQKKLLGDLLLLSKTDSKTKPHELSKEKNLSKKPLSRVPTLDAPIYSLTTDIVTPLKEKLPKNGKTLSQEELAFALQQMKPQTLEDILATICASQLDLEKEHAQTTEKTHSKYLDFQKTQQKMLQEIREVLMKDENVLSYLKTGQAVTLAASLLAGTAAAAISFGLLGPAAAIIGNLAGASAAALFTAAATSLGTIGPAATAGLSSLTFGSRIYMKYKSSEHKAESEEYQHKERYLSERLEDTRNRLSTVAETDGAFKEHWLRLLKRANIMRKLIHRK